MRIVLDTNVVISALVWGGTPYRLIQAAVDGVVTLCTSPALPAELRGVLARRHLASRLERQWSSIDEALSLYGVLSITVCPDAIAPVVPSDPDDDRVIEAAIGAKADLIVSGDRHLLDLASHGRILIVTPAEALVRLGLSR